MEICERCCMPIIESVGECFCIKYRVVDEDNNRHGIFANCAEEAAMAFAQEYNEDCDYALMSRKIRITVDGVPYSIFAEADINYTATNLDEQ